jgi:hypothetical protein
MIGYFSISIQEDTVFLLLVPVLIYVSARLICHAELLIGSMVQYLRTEYEKEIVEIYGRELTHWDSSEAAKTFARKASFFNRNAAIGFIYFVGCWVAGFYRLGSLTNERGLSAANEPLYSSIISAFDNFSPMAALFGVELVFFTLAPIVSYFTIRSAVKRRAKWFAEQGAQQSQSE